MFEIHEGSDGRVHLKGRLDAAAADQAQQVFRGLHGPVVVECSGLDYISSAGISVIMEAYKRLSGAGHSLRFELVTPRVKNVFVYAGLDRLLGIT
jgi:anti-sigma B factor antagonist